jgi:hypothetical protein
MDQASSAGTAARAAPTAGTHPRGAERPAALRVRFQPTSAGRNVQSTKWVDAADRWQRENAGLLGPADLALGRDAGGYCAAHRRVLSYPEQQRGACSWCVPVDPDREPEYWASHWRRFMEGR